MAEAPTLDFNAFVIRKRAERTGGAQEGEHDYSYVLDRQTRATFEQAKPIELAVASTVRMYRQVWRGQLLGNAVRVSDRQFPRIYGIARECAETLGIQAPQIYIVNNPTLNAATYGTDDESFVMVHSALVDHYTDEELRTVLGHECGHIHNKHVVYLTTLHYLKLVAQAYLGVLVAPAMLPLNAWSRRAEITCDRAGMLCAKNEHVAARALTKLVLGSRKLYDEFNIDVFLEQYEEGKDGIGRYMEAFASHPYLPKRVLAMRIFGESELYRKRTSNGTAGLTMVEVDERVKALLKGDA
ncbi:MAG: M48 family metallopeptidase [Polyangiaceae bacterium]|nr:M48 family metallopeptidase [Polyangiaceae bacterium]